MVAVTTTSTTAPTSSVLPNGITTLVSTDSMSVSEIRDQAKSNVQRTKGASVLSLLKAAKDQSTTASFQENAGELKSALRAYIMASSLLQLIFDSTEYRAEALDAKKRGVFWKDFKDFNAHFMNIVVPRTQKLESKLKELEQSHHPSENGDVNGARDSTDGPIRKPGGSIADRMRSLQDAGLSVGLAKRFSRDLSATPSASPRTTSRPPPISPKPSAANFSGLTSPPPTQSSQSVSSPPIPSSTLSSPHAFVSTASLGPPSPTSSTGSIPDLTRSQGTFDLAAFASASASASASISAPAVASTSASASSPTSAPPASRHALHPTRTESEFAHAFPSIDELNERLSTLPSVPSARPSPPAFPSVPTTKPGPDILPPPPSSARDLRGPPSPGSSRHNTGTSVASSSSQPPPPLPPSRPFPSGTDRHMPHQRPASTPIPPTNTTISQPTSPSEQSPVTKPCRELPIPPAVTSSTTDANSVTSPTNPNFVTTTPVRPVNGNASGRVDLPFTNTVYPHVLKDYCSRLGLKILFLDIRTRAEFDVERIRGDEVVCLEPSILTRENVSSANIELALIVSPSSERTLFVNRAKFDLVVMYDTASTAPNHPISNLVRAIFETEYVHSLKRPPVLLVGGLEAWKREAGDEGVVRGSATTGQHAGMNGVKESPGGAVPRGSMVSVHLEPTSTPPDPYARWVPGERSRPGTHDSVVPGARDRPLALYATRTPLTSSPPSSTEAVDGDYTRRLTRKPAMTRPPSSGQVSTMPPRMLSENITGQHMPQSAFGLSQPQYQGPIQYPSAMPSGTVPYPSSSLMGSSSSSSLASSSSFRASTNDVLVSPPPLASINPSPLSRRRSDYVDQAQQPYSGVTRPSIDYPDLSSQHILRPPPAVAPSVLERYDHRPRAAQHGYSFSTSGPPVPTIQSDYPVTFWADVQIGTSGLKNLGNTCYMNSTIQCLNATVPFARFFTDGRWKAAVNMVNPLGTQGNMAKAFASLLHEMWHGDIPYIAPYPFRKSVCLFAPQFGGSDQHDSQEFLSFLLDGLHEDLNRVIQKPQIEATPDREAQLETLPQQIASEQEWKIYRMRNDSLVVDYFQGQFRNRLQCLTCRKTSTTYNPFMYLSLPLPSGRTAKTTLYQCLDAFVKEEVLEKSEAWNCPSCKGLRKATKQLSLSRLPPVFMIHLKRFSFKGPFTDKLETLVDFPLRGLDLTNYLPAPLPPGVDSARVNGITSSEDPRTQLPPYRYDLYAVTNHFGSLSSGHYTAFVSSRGSWMYCDDSRITNAESREIVARSAYVLYYKRVKAR